MKTCNDCQYFEENSVAKILNKDGWCNAPTINIPLLYYPLVEVTQESCENFLEKQNG